VNHPSYYSGDYLASPFDSIRVHLIINENVYNCGIGLEPRHTYLFPFNVQNWYLEEYHKFKSMLDDALLKNEWIHAEVRFCDWGKECVVESGIHVIKHLTNMDDFQFTDSRKNIEPDEYPVMKLPVRLLDSCIVVSTCYIFIHSLSMHFVLVYSQTLFIFFTE